MSTEKNSLEDINANLASELRFIGYLNDVWNCDQVIIIYLRSFERSVNCSDTIVFKVSVLSSSWVS